MNRLKKSTCLQGRSRMPPVARDLAGMIEESLWLDNAGVFRRYISRAAGLSMV
jgi:hypothetical protein